MAQLVAGLIGVEAQTLIGVTTTNEPARVADDPTDCGGRNRTMRTSPETEKAAIIRVIRARRGQGLLKQRPR